MAGNFNCSITAAAAAASRSSKQGQQAAGVAGAGAAGAGAASSSSSRGYAAAVASLVLFACTHQDIWKQQQTKRKQNARTEPKMGNQKIEKENIFFNSFDHPPEIIAAISNQHYDTVSQSHVVL
jgi:hypothetical protein